MAKKKATPANPDFWENRILSYGVKPADQFLAHELNARRHLGNQRDSLRESLNGVGMIAPVLESSLTGKLLDGHARIEEALSRGEDHPIPFCLVRCDTPEEEAFILASYDPISSLATYDAEVWSMVREGINTTTRAIPALEEMFDGIAKSIRATRRYSGGDTFDPTPEEGPTRVKPGDLWVIGKNHRLICGDATDPATVRRLLPKKGVDLILTDPPYCSGGFQETSRAAGSVGTSAEHKPIVNDKLSTRGFIALLKSAFLLANSTYLYCFTDWRMWVHLFDIAESSGFYVRSMIVWDKGTPGMGRGWRSQHELILWACRAVAPFDKHAAGQGNVFTLPRTGNVHHTTEKPVELLTNILSNTPFAKTIYDPFLGSGSTLVAAEREGRQFFGLELDPVYCDVVLRRAEAEGLEVQKAQEKKSGS